MKTRNLLIALACVLAFVAFGVFYFRTWVVTRPFAIILFVGDGLTTSTLSAARMYHDGADSRLVLNTMANVALVKTHANDFAVPDSASAASALATGEKVNNRALSVSSKHDGKPLITLIEIARQKGRAVGIVSNSTLADPSIAAFYAHTEDATRFEEITDQLLATQKIDLALGGGMQDFMPDAKGGRRKDGRDLLLEMREKGYELLQTRSALENVPPWHAGPVLGLFSDADMTYKRKLEAESQQPTLSDMVRSSIRLLQNNRTGYLLVVNAGLIERALGQNDAENALAETLELDHAFETALKYCGDNTLVIATAKQAMGGMSLNGYPLRKDRGVAMLGANVSGLPAVTWSTGPNGASPDAGATPNANPAAVYVPAALQTAEDVIAVGYGPSSNPIRGFLDNTEIFEIIRGNL